MKQINEKFWQEMNDLVLHMRSIFVYLLSKKEKRIRKKRKKKKERKEKRKKEKKKKNKEKVRTFSNILYLVFIS
jgi:hypothetical protein